MCPIIRLKRQKAKTDTDIKKEIEKSIALTGTQ